MRQAVTSGFAERLTAAITHKGLTQTEVGARLGRTQTAISYWCSGKREPGLADLVALAEMLGVSVDFLLGREPNRGDHLERFRQLAERLHKDSAELALLYGPLYHVAQSGDVR